MVSRPVATASREKLLEMHILKLHLRLTESETGNMTQQSVLTGPSSESLRTLL